jgi:hypothetical protein
MPRFEVVEAQPHHCGQMARKIRHEHKEAILRACGDGMTLHRHIRETFDASSYRRALLCDGQMIALGGVTGTLSAAHGFIWMAATEDAKRYPKELIHTVRHLLAEIMVVKRELATTVIESDRAARRFAVFLGFHVAHVGDGSPAATRAQRRALLNHLDLDQSKRLPIGKGGETVIPMGFHLE